MAILLPVAEALRAKGRSVTVEYPGFLSVALRPGGWWAANLGTVNGTWEGEIVNSEGIVQAALMLDEVIPGDSVEVERIAAAILRAVEAWEGSE